MEMIDIILGCLDDNTLNKIIRKCEAYNTYVVDNKQMNKRCEIKTNEKMFNELLERCRSQLVFNQFELSTPKQSENLKSTFESESQPIKENNKKEKKK